MSTHVPKMATTHSSCLDLWMGGYMFSTVVTYGANNADLVPYILILRQRSLRLLDG